MISPELLRRYPFFAHFTNEQLKQIAMFTDEAVVAAGGILFEECQHASTLYLLLEGSVDLFYTAKEKNSSPANKGPQKELSVGEINPGEIFGISALIDPYVLSASGRASKPSKFLKIEAQALRKLFAQDPNAGYLAMQQVAKALLERLDYTRVQLAAAWA
jgi:CRP-like cAMP-binding protein